jgi:CHAT domain-containing protein/tetratricopeptide (TPR) repeat protein
MNRRILGDAEPEVASCLVSLAQLKMESGDYEKAEALFDEALMIERSYHGEKHPEVGRILHGLSSSLLAQGRFGEAEDYLCEAAGIFDTARLRAGSGLTRATFQRSPYSTLAATRLEMGKPEAAWPAAEKALGRALSDLLVSPRQRALSPDEVARGDSLQDALTELEGQVQVFAAVSRPDSLGQDSKELRALRVKLAAADAAWILFQQEVATNHPVAEGESFALDRIQAALGEQTALVGWLHVSVGPDGGDLAPWGYVIRNTGPVHWIRLTPPGGKPDDLATDAPNAFREALALAGSWPFRVTDVERINVDASAVWSQWMEPLASHLEGVDELAVIPSGPIRGIPLEALLDADDVYLGDRYAVSYVPSATLYAWLEEQANGHDPMPGRKALLVGDPPFTADHLVAMEQERESGGSADGVLVASAEFTLEPSVLRSALAGNDEALGRLPRLPRAREEVERVASAMSEATALIGPEASEQELVSLATAGRLREYDTIHLATHTLVDSELPERSALVLSLVDLPDPLDAVMEGGRVYDGLLTLKEILRDWELEADLVTLSGCQTALGREVAGEGSVGLAHAFLQAGARSLLVSLWRVEDEATSLLMGRFYQNLTGTYREERAGMVGASMSKAAALQEAKRWLRTYCDAQDRRPFAHPIYWSGFVLIGES